MQTSIPEPYLVLLGPHKERHLDPLISMEDIGVSCIFGASSKEIRRFENEELLSPEILMLRPYTKTHKIKTNQNIGNHEN